MCKNWLKTSHPFGKKCQKTAGGIFLTHTVHLLADTDTSQYTAKPFKLLTHWFTSTSLHSYLLLPAAFSYHDRTLWAYVLLTVHHVMTTATSLRQQSKCQPIGDHHLPGRPSHIWLRAVKDDRNHCSVLSTTRQLIEMLGLEYAIKKVGR